MISIIICTYNRCESLRTTLESLIDQEADNCFNYEILVADNNSSDKTKDVIMTLAPKYDGRLHYVYEPTQGKSHALNTAISLAAGEVLVFTDDDVTTTKDWLKNIYHEFRNNNSECIFGKILPIWGNSVVPDWLQNNRFLWGKLALLDYGDTSLKVTSDERPFFGANFAILKKTLTEIGKFNVALGRSGEKLLAGEDTDLFERLVAAKKTITYNPEVIVYHRIGKERMVKAYFRKWFFFSAQSSTQNYRDPRNGRMSIPRWFIKKSINELLSYLLSLVSFNEEKRFNCELKAIFNASFYLNSIRGVFINAKD